MNNPYASQRKQPQAQQVYNWPNNAACPLYITSTAELGIWNDSLPPPQLWTKVGDPAHPAPNCPAWQLISSSSGITGTDIVKVPIFRFTTGRPVLNAKSLKRIFSRFALRKPGLMPSWKNRNRNFWFPLPSPGVFVRKAKVFFLAFASHTSRSSWMPFEEVSRGRLPLPRWTLMKLHEVPTRNKLPWCNPPFSNNSLLLNPSNTSIHTSAPQLMPNVSRSASFSRSNWGICCFAQHPPTRPDTLKDAADPFLMTAPDAPV